MTIPLAAFIVTLGFTYVKVRVANQGRPERGVEADLVVDTGAAYTMLPAQMLKDVGVNPLAKKEVQDG